MRVPSLTFHSTRTRSLNVPRLRALPDLSHRAREDEWMDDPELDPTEHEKALGGLARLNRASLASARLFREILRLHREVEPPIRILDLACGGGDILHEVARKARAKGLPVIGVGVDASEVALGYARARGRDFHSDVTFEQADLLRDPLPSGFHLITSSLFLHHLSATDASALLRNAAAATMHSVFVQDLRRSLAGWGLALMGIHALTRSPVVHADGPRSLRSAFTLEEVRDLCAAAGIPDARVEPCWPQRFAIRWSRRNAG